MCRSGEVQTLLPDPILSKTWRCNLILQGECGTRPIGHSSQHRLSVILGFRQPRCDAQRTPPPFRPLTHYHHPISSQPGLLHPPPLFRDQGRQTAHPDLQRSPPSPRTRRLHHQAGPLGTATPRSLMAANRRETSPRGVGSPQTSLRWRRPRWRYRPPRGGGRYRH